MHGVLKGKISIFRNRINNFLSLITDPSINRFSRKLFYSKYHLVIPYNDTNRTSFSRDLYYLGILSFPRPLIRRNCIYFYSYFQANLFKYWKWHSFTHSNDTKKSPFSTQYLNANVGNISISSQPSWLLLLLLKPIVLG